MASGLDVLTGAPSSALVANLDTLMSECRVGPHTLPLSRNEGAATCYVCCPSAAYLDYAVDELRHFSAQPWLKGALRALIAMARPLMKASGLDAQVQPNNWLLSTNILPDLSGEEIAEVTGRLTEKWPGHAIVWRSLNAHCHANLKARFLAAGYVALPSRQIYLFDARDRPPPVHRDEKRDMKLLGQDDFTWTMAFTGADFARMAELYQSLYLDKYTPLNPRYTPLFFERAHAAGWLELHGLRDAASDLVGIIGFFRQGDALTAPVVGYDTSLSAEAGLYRRLMARALKQARDQRLLYNMSGGAAAFKRNRSGAAVLEYMMVYNRHLPQSKRLAGGLVRLILQHVGVPVLQRSAL